MCIHGCMCLWQYIYMCECRHVRACMKMCVIVCLHVRDLHECACMCVLYGHTCLYISTCIYMCVYAWACIQVNVLLPQDCRTCISPVAFSWPNPKSVAIQKWGNYPNYLCDQTISRENNPQEVKLAVMGNRKEACEEAGGTREQFCLLFFLYYLGNYILGGSF